MMVGTCKIKNGRIVTLRKSYPLTSDTHVEVRPLSKVPSLIAASGLSLFGIGFFDLLYTVEIAAIAFGSLAVLFVGFNLAGLIITDLVTRSSHKEVAAYGLISTLEEKRDEIDAAIPSSKGGVS